MTQQEVIDLIRNYITTYPYKVDTSFDDGIVDLVWESGGDAMIASVAESGAVWWWFLPSLKTARCEFHEVRNISDPADIAPIKVAARLREMFEEEVVV